MSALFARILTMCLAPRWALPVFVLALVLAAASRFFRELNRVASGK